MGFLLQHSIRDWAASSPEAEAFRFSGESLSYQELENRSNRLARTLLTAGVRTHDRVGIFMTKGLDLPVALYGILKAGAAYVPIDPAAPRARVEFMLKDCGIRHLVSNVTRRRQLGALGEDCLDAIVGLPSEAELVAAPLVISWDEVETISPEPVDDRTTELDLAYIMYTSGSTGTPKGLMHTHASGLSYARRSAEVYGVRQGDRLGNHSPLHFDMSTFEYLTAPLCGATTVIIPEEVTMFPVSLGKLMEVERLHYWYSVPLALIQLVTAGEVGKRDLSSLRWVIFGGEPFPPKYLWQMMELWPQARFSNSYGPAEVNQCTYYHVPRERKGSSEAIPIGRIWENADGLLLGEGDGPISDGVDLSGELVVRSPGMMRGYWGQPELSERSFYRRERIPGLVETYYRTGDLMSRNEEGELMFLGRLDRQIKIRGYRVELDDVEQCICSSEEVIEAAVVAPRSQEGQREIVAVVRLGETQGKEMDKEGIFRKEAAALLPPYAVPNRWLQCTSFPRTGSGKIDRRTVEATLDGYLPLS